MRVAAVGNIRGLSVVRNTVYEGDSIPAEKTELFAPAVQLEVCVVITLQVIAEEPLLVDKEGYLALPDGPGIGVEIDGEKLAGNVVVT